MLKAFASKGKKDPADDEELLDEGEQDIDELDVPEATSEEDAAHEAAESPEFEAGEEEEAAEDEAEDEDEEIDLDALVELVESGEGDEELLALALDVTEEGNPPAWVMDEDVWEEAKKALEDRKDELADYYAVVTHVYKAMGGEIAEASDEE
jgi:hypothetical protein